jgi:hypothetical protein
VKKQLDNIGRVNVGWYLIGWFEIDENGFVTSYNFTKMGCKVETSAIKITPDCSVKRPEVDFPCVCCVRSMFSMLPELIPLSDKPYRFPSDVGIGGNEIDSADGDGDMQQQDSEFVQNSGILEECGGNMEQQEVEPVDAMLQSEEKGVRDLGARLLCEREREIVDIIEDTAISVAQEVEREMLEKERVFRMNEEVNIPFRLAWDDSSDPNIRKGAISKVSGESGRSRGTRKKSCRKVGPKKRESVRLRQLSITSFMIPRRRAVGYIEMIDIV